MVLHRGWLRLKQFESQLWPDDDWAGTDQLELWRDAYQGGQSHRPARLEVLLLASLAERAVTLGPGAPLYCCRASQVMGSRSASQVVVCVMVRMLYGFSFFLLGAGLSIGQTQRPPAEVLKEAASLHRARQLEQAIEDYRLFL